MGTLKLQLFQLDSTHEASRIFSSMRSYSIVGVYEQMQQSYFLKRNELVSDVCSKGKKNYSRF